MVHVALRQSTLIFHYVS